MRARLSIHRPSMSATVVTVGDLTVGFSYETPVAFYTTETGWVVSENLWSSTTGLHISQIAPPDAPRIDRPTFEERLDFAIGETQP